MKTVAVVPAKGTSERVPNKNMAVLDGEYLFKRKLRQLLACPGIDEVWLDTDADTIADAAADLPIKRMHRPAALATNTADGHEIFAWAASQIPDADILVQALCTAPFVGTRTVTRALDQLHAAPRADSLVAVRRQKNYLWDGETPAYGQGRIPNSTDLAWTVHEAMSLYMVRRTTGSRPPERRWGAKPLLFEIGAEEDIDINTPEDLVFAEKLCAGERAAWNAHASVLRPHLSSSLLSDICAERGLHAVLPPHIRPASPGRILGRVKTLALRAVTTREGDEWRGIYRALDSYAFVRPGDVVVCATKVPDRAYFGDLNAMLAIRAGAVGAVIDGFTRDTPRVRALGLPTYAHGSWCYDIKYEGTLEAMNNPIEIGGVTIANDDVLFADSDGVVVVPAAMWPEISEAAIAGMVREATIVADVIRGETVERIVSANGAF